MAEFEPLLRLGTFALLAGVFWTAEWFVPRRQDGPGRLPRQAVNLALVAINTRLAPDEVGYILRDCDAKLLVVSQAQEERVAGAPQTLRSAMDTWLDAIAPEPAALIADACEGAEMLYSSGTTGRPKGVRAARPGAPLGTVSELFRRRLALHEVDAGAVYLSTAPLYHSAPLRYNAMMHRCGAE